MSIVLQDLKKDKGLIIIHVNIRSLLSKMELVSLDLLDGRLDVVCITESWLHKRVDNAIIEHGQYRLIRQDRIDNNNLSRKVKRGGGLCAYVKKTIDIQFISDDSANLSDHDLEMLHFKFATQKPKES